MNRNLHARDAQLRAIRIFAKRPEYANARTEGTADVRDGLGCIYKEGGHTQNIDMPFAIGGYDEAPTPGFFGRAALSGCIAIGIKMMATRKNIDVDLVRVRIVQNWDNRGVLAMGGANAAAKDTEILVELSSDEEDETLNDLVTRALEADPWFLAYRDAQGVAVSVAITESAS